MNGWLPTVTTRKFLEVFGLATLRDLPDIEKLEDEGLLQRSRSEIAINGALGIFENDEEIAESDENPWGVE